MKHELSLWSEYEDLVTYKVKILQKQYEILDLLFIIKGVENAYGWKFIDSIPNMGHSLIFLIFRKGNSE